MLAANACGLDANGRHDRFHRLCAARRASMVGYVRRLTGNLDTSEDIVQVVLVRAWRSIHTLTDDRAVHAWLNTIVRREVARVYGRKSLQTEDMATLSPTDQLFLSHEETTAIDDVRIVLESMRAPDRQVLLQTLYGYSAEEIAAVDRCSAQQVRMKLFRARRRLRLLLD